jgi:hypothetical protein
MQSLFNAITQAQTEGKRFIKYNDGATDITVYLVEPTPRTVDMMY